MTSALTRKCHTTLTERVTYSISLEKLPSFHACIFYGLFVALPWFLIKYHVWKKYPFSTLGFCMKPQTVFKLSKCGNYLWTRLVLSWKFEFPRKDIWISKITYPTVEIWIPRKVFVQVHRWIKFTTHGNCFQTRSMEITISRKGNLDFQCNRDHTVGTSVTKAGFCMNQAGNDVINIHTSEDMENTPLWFWM